MNSFTFSGPRQKNLRFQMGWLDSVSATDFGGSATDFGAGRSGFESSLGPWARLLMLHCLCSHHIKTNQRAVQ